MSINPFVGIFLSVVCCSNIVFADESVPKSASKYTLQDVCNRLKISESKCTNNAIMARLSSKQKHHKPTTRSITVANKPFSFWDVLMSSAQAADISKTLSADNTTMEAGFYTATTLSTVDSDLAAANIASGITIFGITGSNSNLVDTSSGGANATARDVVSGKKVWVNGVEITGTCIDI